MAKIMPTRASAAAAILLAFSVTAASAADKGYPLETLLSAQQTVLGERLSYPNGDARVTAAIVTLAPGASTIVHEHGVPLFAYMLDGELTVDYGARGKRVYKKGDAFMEAMAVPHAGTNSGDVPVRILAVYIGADGAKNTIATGN